MIWVSVAQNSPYWAPLLGAFQVDGKVIAPSTSNLIAVLDTGTSLAYMSQDLATSVNAAIGATLYSNQGGQTQYSVSCNSIASLPIVTVSLGGHNFNLYPQQYFVAQDPYGQLCLTGFNGMQLDNIGFLIGNVLLRQWYIAFDFANERIGLATANRTAIGVSTGSLNPISGSIYNPGASSSNRDGSGSTAPAVVNPFDQIIHFFSSSPRTTPSPLPFRFVVASIITSFLTVFV